MLLDPFTPRRILIQHGVGQLEPIPIALRIDYIFHTDHFTATKSEVLRRDGSDHALLYAELKIGEQSDAHGAAKSGVLPVENRLSPPGDR